MNLDKNKYLIGQKITEKRKLQGLTQGQLAKLLGIGQQTISRWGKGDAKIPAEYLHKLLQIFQLPKTEADDWLKTLNHRENIKAPKNIPPLTGQALPRPLLPLSSLTEDDFERFITSLLDYIHSPAKVNRLGSKGHKQGGADIEVHFKNNTYFDYQCKRCKQFGPKNVEKAIKEYTRNANEKFIALSRTASPEARAAARKHSWNILDVDDITREIHKLPNEKARRLIDNFFPGQRFALLGINEPGVWQLPEEFFSPFTSKFFNHQWKLVGREGVLKKIINHLDDVDTTIVLISGTGGSGKSKILYELCNSFLENKKIIRILSPGGNITAKDIEDLGTEQLVIAIDDAHEVENLNLLFQTIASKKAQIKILLFTRPYGLENLRGYGYKFSFTDNEMPIVNLNSLTIKEASELAIEVISQIDKSLTYIADDIAKLTYECPLAITIGSYLVAKKQIHPNLLANQNDFKNKLLQSFRDVITGELGSKTNSKSLKSLLQLIALIQPFNPDDEDFKRLTELEIGLHFDEITKFIALLSTAGVIIKRRGYYRIAPDPLADFIIEESCFEANGKPTGYVERIFKNIVTRQLQNFLINLGKLDWRLSNSDKPNSKALDTIWNNLISQQTDITTASEETIEAIISIAIYQPEKSLSFAESLIRHKIHLHLLPRLLKNIGYHTKYLDQVCKLLWQLGKNETPSTKNITEQAIQVLKEICDIEPNKPIAYSETIIEFGLSLIHDENAWKGKVTPLDILKPILATEGFVTETKGIKVTFSRYHISLEAIGTLRTKVIDAALSLLTHQNQIMALHAAKFLNCAMHYPLNISVEKRASWTKEFISIFFKIKSIIISNKINHVILIELLQTLTWFANLAEKPAQIAAQDIINLLPTSIDFCVLQTFITGWSLLRGQSSSSPGLRNEEWEQELDNISEVFFSSVVSNQARLEFLESILLTIHSTRPLIHDAPEILLNKFAKKDIEFSTYVTESVLANPKLEIASYAAIFLAVVITNNRNHGILIAKQLLELGLDSQLFTVAHAFNLKGKNDEAFSQEEVSIVKTLCHSTNQSVLFAISNAIAQVGIINPRQATELLLEIKFSNHGNLADRVLYIVSENVIFQELLRQKGYITIFNKLYNFETLNKYGIELFLSKMSFAEPNITASFLMKRVDLAAEHNNWKFQPFSFGPYASNHASLRFQETDSKFQIMQSLREWMKSQNQTRMFSKYSAELFAAMFSTFDESIISFLEDWATSGAKIDIEIIANILSNTDYDFVITQSKFTEKFLKLAEQFGMECVDHAENCLFKAVLSGGKSGTLGSPFPKDVKIKEATQNLLMQLPRFSNARAFYEKLLNYTNSEIQRSLQERSSFEDEY